MLPACRCQPVVAQPKPLQQQGKTDDKLHIPTGITGNHFLAFMLDLTAASEKITESPEKTVAHRVCKGTY